MNWFGQRWQNRAIYRYHFLQSTYISSIWTWFLTFWGKAAEPFLCVSVLYSGAKLLPGVSTSATVDTVMFIGQMLALDIGGLSLGKIAQQLAREGNGEQAGFIKKVSFFLISLMIANVVLATVQHLFPGLDPRWITGVESVLLIVRSVMAVIYGYIIYNLHSGGKQETSVVKSSDVKSQYEELVNRLAVLERTFTEQCVNLNQETREEFTRRLQVHSLNLHTHMREEFTTAFQQQSVNLHTHVVEMVQGHDANIGTQVTLALNEHSKSLTASLSQQLNEHLAKLTAQMVEEITGAIRHPVKVHKLVKTDELASPVKVHTTESLSPVNTHRKKITVFPVNVGGSVKTHDDAEVHTSVNASEKKRQVKECLALHPELRDSEIIRLLKEQGVDVAPSYISMIRNGKRA